MRLESSLAWLGYVECSREHAQRDGSNYPRDLTTSHGHTKSALEEFYDKACLSDFYSKCELNIRSTFTYRLPSHCLKNFIFLSLGFQDFLKFKMSLHVNSSVVPASINQEASTRSLSALVHKPGVVSSTQVEPLEGQDTFSTKGTTEATPPHAELSNASPKTVLVVGAGISGLRAASILKRHGLHVIVLEARGRIGGRIQTSRKNGKPARDMGASIRKWCFPGFCRGTLNSMWGTAPASFFLSDKSTFHRMSFAQSV